MKFRATILQSGKTATGIEVPEEVVAGFGAGKRVLVLATINGYTYRSSVAPYNGKYMLPVSAEVRAAAGVAGGDEVEVDLELDSAPREVEVPADLAAALADDAEAARFFSTLSYSNKRWYVSWIESARRAETRQQRVAKAVEMLREGKTGA